MLLSNPRVYRKDYLDLVAETIPMVWTLKLAPCESGNSLNRLPLQVKMQVSKVAVLMEDESPKIASTAKFFFLQLSKRNAKSGNPIANLLPEILSNLLGNSDHSAALFEPIIRQLLQYTGYSVQETLPICGCLCTTSSMILPCRGSFGVCSCLTMCTFMDTVWRVEIVWSKNCAKGFMMRTIQLLKEALRLQFTCCNSVRRG